MRGLAVTAVIGGLLLSSAAEAQPTRVGCLGDSITEGALPFDEENFGGYPRRLQPLLRQGGMKDAVVKNFGVGGDTTVELLGRVGSVVGGIDVLVLLGGTNDVDDIATGRFLMDDTIRNLDIILRFVEDRGLRGIVGTVPPRRPGARRDPNNTTTYELVRRIRQLAHNKRYELVDFWHIFPNRQRSTYALYYHPSGGDTIGHPRAAGFQLMAEAAAGVILDGDRQSPVEGRFLAPGNVDKVNPNTDYEIELFDFDSGIFRPSATFVINGEPIDTVVTGNARKSRLFAEGDGRRRCKVVLSVRASDRAEPPNELDFYVSTFATPRQLITGDANGDCRVDGRDLAIFGPVFGKVRNDLGFDDEMDFVKNGVIDGEDFARLAANFGRGELPPAAR
jgi:lysophospholipase L1-like esterase